MEKKLLSLREASEWATSFIGRPVTLSNIQYLIQYAKVRRQSNGDGYVIELEELRDYYETNILKKQEQWKKHLGADLDWSLSFAHLREADTTKHVHRLHPYKGKFIPQLVEYFLDQHINTHKKEIYFAPGNIILDPFAGSGTTLIQAAELGIHSIGIDVSEFNCLISRIKSERYDFIRLESNLKDALKKIQVFINKTFDESFNFKLKERLSQFNSEYFPNPEFKYKVYQGEINEEKYAEEKLKQFISENKELIKEGEANDWPKFDMEKEVSNFIKKWFSKRIQQELFFYLDLINNIEDEKIRNVMQIILSRTARSCRATTHSDLATLKNPQIGPYYCHKHRKICVPIDSILKHLTRNTFDTIKRLYQFSELRRNVNISVIDGDSREVNIFNEIKKQNQIFYDLLVKKKIAGIFTSPPYVGQIDYHEQHAYAYDLFNIRRKDIKEIGPMYGGQGEQARKAYIEGITEVMLNSNKFLKDDANIFIVANDKFNLYPKIAEKSGLKIVNKFKRPVLNRTERDRNPYAEIIFHMKKV